MFLKTNDLMDGEIFLKLEKTEDADPAKNWVPVYYFKICRLQDKTQVGVCDLRIGHNERVYYGGNIGYTVYEQFRGKHYAGKACRLLLPFAKKHGLDYLYITCNPDNFASRKTCEFVGGTLRGIVDLPMDNDMYLDGHRKKCIYYFGL